MKSQIATTREQADRLLKCGVLVSTADMHWDNKTLDEPFLDTGEVADKWDIPAWSLSRLLALLPKEIEIDGYPYRISIYFENPDEPVIGNQWCLYYKPKKHNEKSRIDDVTMYAPDLIECAVLMVEWLTANNYKLNGIEKGGEE